MSTRCNIHFSYGTKVEANIYRHSDGYPDTEHGVLSDLKKFFKAVKKQTNDTRFTDPSYLAAKFVVWQAAQNVAGTRATLKRMASTPELAEYAKTHSPGGNLDFLSIGIMAKDAGDGEYVYNVNCELMDKDGFPTVTYRSK